MMKFLQAVHYLFFLLFTCLPLTNSFAWYDKTHIMIAKASGYEQWYNAAGPDIAKLKLFSERYNHFFNNFTDQEITSSMVLRQAERYNKDNISDVEGHLYGAIIASIREYKKAKESGQYAEYHLAYTSHYIGDLSQPLHNIPYNAFNRRVHGTNDGIIDDIVMNNEDKIKKQMKVIRLVNNDFELTLANEIARIANDARKLGLLLEKENRNMTHQEAWRQLGESASLFRFILERLGKVQPNS